MTRKLSLLPSADFARSDNRFNALLERVQDDELLRDAERGLLPTTRFLAGKNL